ncbi:RNase H domain-containing protein [Trichonephila clavipes]|nr:RNase H domain-containing protein [Trichonephila clavipes]
MKRTYDARPHNIRPFIERTKLLLSEFDLPDVDIHQRNFLQFQTWNTPRLHYINPYATYNGSSKRTDYVGCGVVMEDNMRGYRLNNCCNIFTAEVIALNRALQLIDPKTPRKYCIYIDNPPPCLTVGRRQSRSYACAGVVHPPCCREKCEKRFVGAYYFFPFIIRPGFESETPL